MARAIMSGSADKGSAAVIRLHTRKVAANKRQLSKG
jgi:hypothetical protein